MTDVESSAGTPSSPGSGGRDGRAPVLRKTHGAVSATVRPSLRRTSRVCGPVKRASPIIRSTPARARPRGGRPAPPALGEVSGAGGSAPGAARGAAAARPAPNAVIARPPRQVRHASAGDHRLGGRAALVEAGAADVGPLHHGGAPP